MLRLYYAFRLTSQSHAGRPEAVFYDITAETAMKSYTQGLRFRTWMIYCDASDYVAGEVASSEQAF